MNDTAQKESSVTSVENASAESQLQLAHAKIADLEEQLRALKDHVGAISNGMAPAVEMTSSSPVTTEEGKAAGDAAQQIMNEANPTIASEPKVEPFSPPVVTEEAPSHVETPQVLAPEPAPTTLSSLGAPMTAPMDMPSVDTAAPTNLTQTTEMTTPIPNIPATEVSVTTPAVTEAPAVVSTPEATTQPQVQETAPVASVAPMVTEPPKTMPFQEPQAEMPAEEKKSGGLLGMLGIHIKKVDSQNPEQAQLPSAPAVTEERPKIQDFINSQPVTEPISAPTVGGETGPSLTATVPPTETLATAPVPEPVGSAAPVDTPSSPAGSAAPVEAQYAQATSSLPVQPYTAPQYNPYASLNVNPNPDETLVNY